MFLTFVCNGYYSTLQYVQNVLRGLSRHMVKQTQSSNQTQLFSPYRISSQKPSNVFSEFAFSSFPNIHDRQDEANLSTTTYHNFLFHSSILPASQRKILPFATLPPSKSRVFVDLSFFRGEKTHLPPKIPNPKLPTCHGSWLEKSDALDDQCKTAPGLGD